MHAAAKFEVRSFTRSWDNWGYPKIWAVAGYAHAHFSPKFLMDFCSDGMFWPHLKSVALPLSEKMAIVFLFFGGWGCEPPILGKRRP